MSYLKTSQDKASFLLNTSKQPQGDQPKAIQFLTNSLEQGNRNQVLLGITGSGKTFTMANIIRNLGRPAVIMAHNKTLAAQLYAEMKSLFPNNAVEYFVSYYDYYQPEAYIARTDTYIEKDASINEQIDLLRHSATRSLLERRDVIVVASVSMIYGIGSPDLYQKMTISLEKGQCYVIDKLLIELVHLQYERNDIEFKTGSFRVRGDVIDIMPAHYSTKAWRLSFFGDMLEDIYEIDALTGEKLSSLNKAIIFANSHFVTPRPLLEQAMKTIRAELDERHEWFISQNKLVEAQRIKQKVMYDLEVLNATNHCKGIENYSRHFTGAREGSVPSTLFEYIPKDAILFIDESHVSVPQIGGMYGGDRARKEALVEHGFRLPSAFDNRPLKFDEWENLRPQTVFVSATPAEYELKKSGSQIVEMIIRPTGLLDPKCEIRPTEKQVEDLAQELEITINNGFRALVTCLTKKMAEDLSSFLSDKGFKCRYIHSDVETLDRIEILNDLRSGNIDVLIGINLLREGLDIPECGLVAILDADKEGFLRSKVSLIQTMGRAARNVEGRVILYADYITQSIRYALEENNRRRKIQQDFNEKHGIVPQTTKRDLSVLSELTAKPKDDADKKKGPSGKREDLHFKNESDLSKAIKQTRRRMEKLAKEMKFEEAAQLRDQIQQMESMRLGL